MKAALVFLVWGLMATVLVPSSAAATPRCFGHAATIVGSGASDRLEGTHGPDVIVGLGGADFIHGRGGNDRICLGRGKTDPDSIGTCERARGGRGNDRISGGRGSDCLDGGDGNDRLIAGPTSSSLMRGSDDGMDGGSGADVLIGSAADDGMNGGAGADVMRGKGGTDGFYGDTGDDVFDGGGDGLYGDFVLFEGSNVVVDLSRGEASGQGRDLLSDIENVEGPRLGGTLIGDDGANILVGHSGDDVLLGMRGGDCLYAGGGDNMLDGGDGVDAYAASIGTMCSDVSFPSGIFGVAPMNGSVEVDLAEGTATRGDGEFENSILESIENAFGTSNSDTVSGDAQSNELFGAGGRDELHGREGDDQLDGGAEVDALDGGDGTDRCANGEVNLSCEGSLRRGGRLALDHSYPDHVRWGTTRRPWR